MAPHLRLRLKKFQQKQKSGYTGVAQNIYGDDCFACVHALCAK